MKENSHPLVTEVHQTKPRPGIMLRITTEKKRSKVVLTVEGRLTGQTVPTLEQCWRELRAASPGGKGGINPFGGPFISPPRQALPKGIPGPGRAPTCARV